VNMRRGIFRRHDLSLAALALALLGPCAALAHDATTLDRIDVIGHYDNGVGTSDAASEGSVTAKLIENRPVLRPAEILEFVPGVVITQHSGDGKANQYFLRGFNLDHGTDFATFVDGMPVNMPTHAHGQGYSDLNFLIPELVRRIDYRKGPYFASEGDFSSAGAAHILLADQLAANIAQLTLGTFGYRRAVLAASPEAPHGHWLFALEAAENNGPWDNPEALRKWSGIARYSSGTRSDGWSVTAMGYESHWNSTDQIPLRAVESGALDRFGAIDPTDGGSTARYSLSADWRRGDDAGVTQLNAYAIRSRLDLFSDFTYFLDHPDTGDQFEQAEHRTILGGNASRKWVSHWGGLDVVQSMGLQLRSDRVEPVGLYETVARSRVATTSEDRVTEASAGVYYENVVQWRETFRTLAGLRYDRYRFDVASDNAANSGTVDSGIVSPKFSAVWRPGIDAELFANWGRGFHSNDARGATLTVEPGTGQPSQRVTPLVRSTGSEAGLRMEPLPGLQSSVALWQLKLDSELVFAGDAGTTEPSRPSLRRGIEWNNHYTVNAHWLADLDVSVSRARFADDDPVGAYIPGAIERVVSLGVAAVDLGAWSGSAQLRYFGPRALIEDDSVRSRSTLLVNARLAYRIDPRWRVSLDVFNLLDRKASDVDYFYASRLRGEPADGIADIHFHPVEPRSARLTLQGRF
jgi:outer membrane receptor protein involved in Fe transport